LRANTNSFFVYVLSISILYILVSCNSQPENDENYYFPVKDLFSEKTYCFVNLNDTTEKAFWKTKTYVSDNDTFLQTTISDKKDGIMDETLEKISNGDSKLISYTLNDYDDKGNKFTSQSMIIDSSLFKSNQKIGEKIQWKIRYKNFRSTDTCEFSKIRTLVKTDRNLKTFSDQMKIEDLKTKRSHCYSVTMIYQKNLGLASYEMMFPEGGNKNFIFISSK